MDNKFKAATYGCSTNRCESLAMKYQLKSLIFVNNSNKDDVYILNAFYETKAANETAVKHKKKLKNKWPNSKIYYKFCVGEEGKRNLTPGKNIVPSKEKEELVSKIFSRQDVLKLTIKNFEKRTDDFIHGKLCK